MVTPPEVPPPSSVGTPSPQYVSVSVLVQQSHSGLQSPSQYRNNTSRCSDLKPERLTNNTLALIQRLVGSAEKMAS